MQPRVPFRTVVCAAMLLSAAVGSGAEPKVEAKALANGIRVRYLHLPKSKHLCIFTFLPLGLANDEPGRASWSHLIEHLAIRTTISGDLRQANAETLADYLRLDFYGTVDNWREALSHHQRWLRGLPFSEEGIRTERAQANAEADHVAQRAMTHKFAFAAWGQVYRHGRGHAAIKGDLETATLKDLQQYRDRHLFVPGQTLVCAVGGVDPKEFLRAAEESLGGLTSPAKPSPPVKVHPGVRQATWDLDAGHLLLCWRIPGPEKPEDFAALWLASQVVMFFAAQDADVQRLAGPVLAGTDLASPEGTYFYLSAPFRPQVSSDEIRKKLIASVQRLTEPQGAQVPVSLLGGQLAKMLRPQDPDAVKGQMPANVPAWMAEANAAIFWGSQEFRYGSHLGPMIERLEKMTIQEVQRVVKAYLTPSQSSVLILSPAARKRGAGSGG